MKPVFEKAWKKFVEDATPEMEEYLKKHPYMEMDGLQEDAGTAAMPTHLKNRSAQWVKDTQEILNQEMPSWVALKMLGQGASGMVFLIENQNNGERRALKLVDRDKSEYYESEKSSYEWVMLNRDSLPEDVKAYLPIVQQVWEVTVFKYTTMLMITMEVLKPLPKQVVDDLLAGTDVNLTVGKEERILADYDSVKEVTIKTVAGSLILRQIMTDELGMEKSRGVEGLNMIEDIETSAVEMFYTGRTPQNVIDAVRANSDSFESGRGPGKKSLELIAAIVLQILRRLEVEQTSLLPSLIGDLSRYMKSAIGGFVVPIHADEDVHWMGQASDTIGKNLPERSGIIDAINYLQNERDVVARDIHHKNVMMRPADGQMVIMDLGLFRIGNSA
tara:strand:+ start:10463 stop:11626 length:1164 start_codon:yes stop_codon:yes gene_type:complete